MPKDRKTVKPKARGPKEETPNTSRDTLKTLKAEFDAAHAKGMAALRSGDFDSLRKAIDAERRAIDQQRALLPPRTRAKQAGPSHTIRIWTILVELRIDSRRC